MTQVLQSSHIITLTLLPISTLIELVFTFEFYFITQSLNHATNHQTRNIGATVIPSPLFILHIKIIINIGIFQSAQPGLCCSNEWHPNLSDFTKQKFIFYSPKVFCIRPPCEDSALHASLLLSDLCLYMCFHRHRLLNNGRSHQGSSMFGPRSDICSYCPQPIGQY